MSTKERAAAVVAELQSLTMSQFASKETLLDARQTAIENAIAAAERAAYERAAKAIQCSYYDDGGICCAVDCCAPNVRAILSLIDKPKEPT